MKEYRVVVDKETGEMRKVPLGEYQLSSQSTLTGLDLANIESMSKGDLIDLIRKLAGASGMVSLALLTPDELKAATRLRLSEIALRNKDDKVALQAIQQLLDRLEGKPVGSSSNIMIGSSNREQTIKVVFVTPEQVRREKEEKMKLIDNQ